MLQVESLAVARAFRQLAWTGEVIGPVTFGGLTFWACVQLNREEHGRRQAIGLGANTDRHVLDRELRLEGEASGRARPPLRLEGCMVVSRDDGAALRDASLLAGYAARAVLVPNRRDVLGLLADAALLDQGVVLRRRDGVTVLAQAGPRISGNGFDAREWELLERVYEVYAHQASVPTS